MTRLGRPQRAAPAAMLALALALALAGVSGAAHGSNDSAPTTPAPTSPGDGSPCVVSGPALLDRRAPLRTALPPGHTLIALTADERRQLPDRLPASVAARLKDEGAMLSRLDADGSVVIKSMWRRTRRAAGRLHVTGTRLDAAGGRFRAIIDRNYGGRTYSPFIPGTLGFSAPGCWRIKARAGNVRVTYVALVRRPNAGEFAPYLP